jgi:uncharacterized protein (DUF111 family)
MIFIDVREGLSGDMLLAGMIGLLDDSVRMRATDLLGVVSQRRDIRFQIMGIEEDHEKGLGISYTQREVRQRDASYDECFDRLREIEKELGSESVVGKKILTNIFEAEAEAHRLPVRDVHLHEIGRTQAMMNIAGISFVSDLLSKGGDEEFVCSTIVTGKGVVVVSHGAIRIPAPASAFLLRGLKHEQGSSPGERATPTGIAAVKTLVSTQSDDLPERFSRRSIGFGTKRFGGRLGRTTLYKAKTDLTAKAQGISKE